ncbi:MAG: hypothetical protein ACRC2T_03250 [Thermoguttaceae bacterium]
MKTQVNFVGEWRIAKILRQVCGVFVLFSSLVGLKNPCLAEDAYKNTSQPPTSVIVSDSSGKSLIDYDIAVGTQYNFSDNLIETKIRTHETSINLAEILKKPNIQKASYYPMLAITSNWIDTRLALWIIKEGFEPCGIPLPIFFSTKKSLVTLERKKIFTISLESITKKFSNVQEGLLLCWNIDSKAGYQFCQWEQDLSNISIDIICKQRYGVVIAFISKESTVILRSVFFVNKNGDVEFCQDTKCYNIQLKSIDLTNPSVIKICKINRADNKLVFPPNKLNELDGRIDIGMIDAQIKYSMKQKNCAPLDILYFCDPTGAYYILFLNNDDSTSAIYPVTD